MGGGGGEAAASLSSLATAIAERQQTGLTGARVNYCRSTVTRTNIRRLATSSFLKRASFVKLGRAKAVSSLAIAIAERQQTGMTSALG